jgi:hypothetical protein
VDQVEIDVLKAELLKADVDGGVGGGAALVGVPQLCGDEQFFARDARGGERTANALLVAVDSGGVDVAVTDLECV